MIVIKITSVGALSNGLRLIQSPKGGWGKFKINLNTLPFMAGASYY